MPDVNAAMGAEIERIHAELRPAFERLMNGWPHGACHHTAWIFREAVEALLDGDAGRDAELNKPLLLVGGDRRYRELGEEFDYHNWLQYGDTIIDPTGRQFEPDAALIVRPGEPAYDAYEPTSWVEVKKHETLRQEAM